MGLGFFGALIGVPVALWALRQFGFYVTVQERTCHVYVLFGEVEGVLQEPGLHSLFKVMGWKALIVNWFGTCKKVDLRTDQQYLRSQAVNSEEGAPMGIGVWYEMFISDPVKFLFENADPRGSLAANVSNATVRALSNMKLSEMLETRHNMSRSVRNEVSPTSARWGYTLGSVYIRKVHFRDEGMNSQIEEKVVNRLRQVTGAIRQDGTNQVNIISSTAERQAAVAFAKAQALRPQIVGMALEKIGKDPEVMDAMFEILEIKTLVEGNAKITLLPEGQKDMELVPQLIAANPLLGIAR